MRNSLSRSYGLTLVELMISLVVLSIVVAIAVPSFNNFIESNRTTSAANDLATAIGMARAEATARGRNVSIVSIDTSSASGNWGAGWCIAEGAPTDCSGTVINTMPYDGAVSVSSTSTLLTFNSRGILTAGAAATIDVCGATASDRRVRISATGQATLTAVSC